MSLPVRNAARVLLIDPEDRVLLFRSHPSNGRAFWFPVGGEIDPGESAADAAVRECFEETGLVGLELGAEVFSRRFVFHWRERVWDARERWFIAHVEHFTPVFDHMEAIEIDDFSDCRWLSVDELRSVQTAGDLLTPSELLELLPELLAGRYPEAPISVGE
ncbi:MAG: NUDIX domain-containing protein [Solirubrobacterales bacterium]|nr:NUDIX domain-containing protein [Solirubrobacterales bacterium]